MGKKLKLAVAFVLLGATVLSSGCAAVGAGLGAGIGTLAGNPGAGAAIGGAVGLAGDLYGAYLREQELEKKREDALKARADALERGIKDCWEGSYQSTNRSPEAWQRCQVFQRTTGTLFTTGSPNVAGHYQIDLKAPPPPSPPPYPRRSGVAPSPGNYSGVTEAPIAFETPPPFYNGAPPQPPRRRHVYYQYN